jgi:glycosyltransferase involved in cell wall biosynthesis
MEEYPEISIVVIGYNEEDNLGKTFRAIEKMNYPRNKYEVIYVDSGSTDRSVEIAKTFCDKVCIEDQFPSPGRNRNRGLLEASSEIVHFIDGDVTIHKDYLAQVVHLFAEKQVQAIVGQLDEQNPNIYEKMASLSNASKKEGYTKFTSTGATYLRSALLSVNGYDERIRRGQESELGERFREAGYRIWCTHFKMGSHSFDLNNMRQYLRKYEINAKSLFQVSLIQGDSHFILSAKKKMIKQLLKFLLFIVCLTFSIWLNSLVYLASFLVLAWISRNKSLYARRFVQYPGLTLLRSLIDFFFFWVWWVGFFRELHKFLFSKKTREFYNLPKMMLKYR